MNYGEYKNHVVYKIEYLDRGALVGFVGIQNYKSISKRRDVLFDFTNATVCCLDNFKYSRRI